MADMLECADSLGESISHDDLAVFFDMASPVYADDTSTHTNTPKYVGNQTKSKCGKK